MARRLSGWCIVRTQFTPLILHCQERGREVEFLALPANIHNTPTMRLDSTTADSKRILIVAGPNGAGKTTFAREFLLKEADCPTFVNADYMAAGLNPFCPDMVAVRAGKLMLELIDEYVRKGESFTLETTLSGRGYSRKIPAWREQGYWVKLYYLTLPSPDIAIARVRQRVSEGGHDVPVETVHRRFHAGRRNFGSIYRHLVDEWVMYDNLGLTPMLLEQGGINR